MTRRNVHDMMVERLLNKPEDLGLEGVIWRAKEVQLYEGVDLWSVPDLVFLTQFGEALPEWNIFEYKCNGTNKSLYTAKKQLQKSYEWFERHLREVPNLFLAYGSLPVWQSYDPHTKNTRRWK